jgi:hypothetical protein
MTHLKYITYLGNTYKLEAGDFIMVEKEKGEEENFSNFLISHFY